ncbi:MAG: Na+/H+ antiporter NhaC family protein [Clostridia bacterium]
MEFSAVGTFLAILPPIIAIALALLTKEVYTSLFIGIFAGALLYTNCNIISSLETIFAIMGEKVGGNINIVIFLVFLGVLVSLMSRSGASAAYGKWASRSIKSKRGALLATSALGALIFVDDYFNCLTVGTVMTPVTDRYKITRAKLAYIIDATAAPICIIAPISSWAAAVGSSLPEESAIDGFSLFLRTIPFNFYALLTIVMLLVIMILNFDFGKMAKYNKENPVVTREAEEESNIKGKVLDLILPIAFLIVSCIFFMLYTGGIFDGVGIVAAFADCSSALSLALGSFVTIIFTFILYLPRKVVSFKEFSESLTDGFKAMVPAIMILTLAWTLSGICDADFLDAGGFVAGVVQTYHVSMAILPVIFFLVALGLAFATGTSWGTFGILIPIIISVFGGVDSTLLAITVSASLAGAVCGDHCSPISDTTILASTGARCDHIDHVSTQLPYVLLVAACSCVAYIFAGFTQSLVLSLAVGVVLLVAILLFFYKKSKAHN